MSRLLLLATTIWFLFLIIGCQQNSPSTEKIEEESYSLKDYYYPIDSLKDGWVYEYINVADGSTSHYWLYKTVFDEAGDCYLIGTFYNPIFEQQFFSREWVLADGTMQKDYKIFQFDSATQKTVVRQAEVEESVVFPFQPVLDTSLAYRFKLRFSMLPDTNLWVTLIRDRQFGEFVDYDFNGNIIRAAKFNNMEYYDMDGTTGGGSWQLSSPMTEIYAKGIGLVYSKKTINNQLIELKLKKRHTIKEFESIGKLREK